MNYGIAISAFATQLILYDLGVGNHSMVNESNLIGEFDDLWIGDHAEWFKIVELRGDTIILHGKLFQVTFKSYTRL